MKILLIIDIDNTLAENAHRENILPNWEAFYHACDKDESIEPIIDALRPYLNHELVEPVFLTGRTGYPEVKTKTQVWLSNRGIENFPIYYRGLKDFSKSHVFKEGVLNTLKKDNHEKVIIVDDDKNITSHFSSLGHYAVTVMKDDNYVGTANKIKETLDTLILSLQTKNNLTPKPLESSLNNTI